MEMSNNPVKYEVLIKQYLRLILDISVKVVLQNVLCPLPNFSDNRGKCQAPRLGGQFSKPRSSEMTFLGDASNRNTSFILTSYWNLKKRYYFKIFTEASASVCLCIFLWSYKFPPVIHTHNDHTQNILFSNIILSDQTLKFVPHSILDQK